MIKLAGRSAMALQHLKSRDDRKKRRAVRELFEIDNEGNLESFIPLLNDKDNWYRTKALDAFKTWAKRRDLATLEVLINHKKIEYNRVAANMLLSFKAEDSNLAKILFDKDDLLCKIKSCEYILKCENQDDFFASVKNHESPKIRAIALNSKYADSKIVETMLEDESNNVVQAALKKLQDSNVRLSSKSITSMLKNGVDPKLIIPHALSNDQKIVTTLVKSLDSNGKKEFVKYLRKKFTGIEDEIIQILINNSEYNIVGRWLQGKRGEKIDLLRWEIISNDEVDEIERCRLIERLFSRVNEPEIIEQAKKIANNSTSELIRITAHNLSTAGSQQQS